MKCYRDRTYCTAHDCESWPCARSATRYVYEQARFFGLDVSQVDRFECFKSKPATENPNNGQTTRPGD